MRVVITGAAGGVGTVVATVLSEAGHELTLTDRRIGETGAHRFIQADLQQYGEAAYLCEGQDAVVHAGAIPDPTHHSPSTIFANNVLSTYNVIEAARRSPSVQRVVYVSSETVLGYQYGVEGTWPPELPVDETTPTRPTDPYGLSKLLGERILESACDSGWLTGVSLRPAWVQYPWTYQRELGPVIADPSREYAGLWCYTDGFDLADAVALSLDAPLTGHHAYFVVNPDSMGSVDVVAQARAILPTETKPWRLPPGTAAISSAKAMEQLGWRPRRSWKDFIRPGEQEVR